MIDATFVESEHVAPFKHGDDRHSFTSLSQLPLLQNLLLQLPAQKVPIVFPGCPYADKSKLHPTVETAKEQLPLTVDGRYFEMLLMSDTTSTQAPI